MSSRRARRKRRKGGWAKCPKCSKTMYANHEEGQPIECYHCNYEWDTVTCCWQCGRPWGDLIDRKEKRQRRAASRTIRIKVRV